MLPPHDPSEGPPAGSETGQAPSRAPPPPPSQSSAEPPGEVPTSLPQPSAAQHQNALVEPPTTKPEGSAYAGAYRPAPVQNVPSVDHDFHLNQINDAAESSHDHPPPAYTELPGEISDETNDLGTNAVVADDGRVNIRINQKNQRLSQIIVPQLQRQLTQIDDEPALPPPYVPEFLGGAPGQKPPPPLNVVIHVVGSRGDVQPFVALGKVLKETYGHRVRLATHPTFEKFVTENGLEFFSIGGDPAELMAFMVKNPGLMPGFETLRSGDVGKRRKGIAEMLRGTWRSCIETGDGLGIDPLKQSVEEWMGIEARLPEELKKPFVADAIIANPPSFGHVHCAEKLGIPLHIMFTMPWSPTQQFPHPLANIQASNADASITNFMSYTLVDMLTWQGLGDVINKFRKDSLGLDPISMIWAPGMLARMKIPYTYCWSPALIPKPTDWAHHISISGFFFLSLAQNYTPEPALAEFLAAGEPPVYIGFGSIVVDDPNAMTQMIFEAVKLTGRRALVSKGWGGLGADELGIPEGVFMLGNCPHDWLFKHVSAVVHHGGAGTTAAGIAAGRPTVVVPFFGDQPFWGAMTAKAGAGPMPIPYKDLTAEKLAGAINEALKPESLERAQDLSNRISKEQGTQQGAQSFHQMLKYDDLRCAVVPERPAVWRLKRTQVRLSARAATILAQEGELNFSELKLFRPREYETDEGPWDPITGGASAIIGTATTMMMGVADFPIETLKLLNIHPDTKKGKARAKDSETGSGPGDIRRTGRSTVSRSTTNMQASAGSSSSTLPGVQSPIIPRGSSDGINRSSMDAPEVASPRSPGTPTTPSNRSAFVAQALSASTQVSRSPSRDRSCTFSPSTDRRHGRAKSTTTTTFDLQSSATSSSTFSDRFHNMNAEAAVGTGKGIGRIVGAGFKSPMEFSLNVAKGFHNVPKLYGGEVRQVDKVTDFNSGIRTGVKELGLGFFEGLTGLVTDPYRGAKKEGPAGFVKGVGRGIAGVPLKVMGGVFSLPGYAMKGLYQEALKDKGANVQNYIIAARISQGYDEAASLTPEERTDIVTRWKCIRTNVKKKKNPGEEQLQSLHTFMKERKNKRQDHWNKFNSHFKRPEARPRLPPGTENRSYAELPNSQLAAEAPGTSLHRASLAELENTQLSVETYGTPMQHANTFPRSAAHAQLSPGELKAASEEEEAERRELEAAIAASVSEASRGNAEEDELIARAIRASISELERPASQDEDEEEAVQRAMRASVDEAGKSGANEEEKRLIEETLRASLLETRKEKRSDSEWDDSDTEDDEDYRRIIEESKRVADLEHGLPPDYQAATSGQDSRVVGATDEDEVELKKIIHESEIVERERMQELERQKTEEDIVMEYVKKQSLAEEEHRRKLAQGRDTVGESSTNAGGSGV